MPLEERLEAFEEVLRLSAPLVGDEALGEARALLRRVDERRRLSLAHTVVALAGASGSGKSSLFNAVCGLDLSVVGARRPTTTNAVACVWDPQGAQEVLDRLRVPERLRFARREVVDAERFTAKEELAGLILLDLPDHDSVDTRHRAEVDRLVDLVDAVVWVLDPEKYADVGVHERYIRPLAGHADVMVVVLNQVDRLPCDAVSQCMADLRRLLDEGGLAVREHGEDGTQVLGASALTGEGVDELRLWLQDVVGERGSVNRRISADLDRAARALRPMYVGGAPPPAPGLRVGVRERFLGRLGEAVGAEAAGEAAERAFLRQVERVWAPPHRALLPRGVARSRRRSPGQTRYGASHQPMTGRHTVFPVRPHQATVAEALHELGREVSAGLPRSWARGVREWIERGGRELLGDMEKTLPHAVPLDVATPWWAVVARLAQWARLAVTLVGGVGLVVGATGVWFWSWGLSAALVASGSLAGPAIALACRGAARVPARRHGDAVRRRWRELVEERGTARVLVPVEAELRRYQAVRERFGVAMGYWTVP